MADVNWKSIGGISIIGGLIGYIGAWNKDRRYKNKFGVFDAEKRQEISELVCVVCGIKDEIANYNWDEDAKGCCGRGVQEKRYFQYGADESFSAETGKRMYCPNCKKNRTWMRGFRPSNKEYCLPTCEGDNCYGCNNEPRPNIYIRLKG